MVIPRENKSMWSGVARAIISMDRAASSL